MSYEVYKMLHLLCVAFVLTGFSIAFWGGNYAKVFKIGTGIATILILVSGMGLMARLGVGHTGGWPMWINLKVLIWAAICIGGPIIIKRAPNKGKLAYAVMMSLFLVVTLLVNYKPE